MKIIARSNIFVFFFFFFLLSSAVDAQSSSGTAASSNPPLHTWDVSFAPVIVALVCAFFFVGSFAIYLRHCSDVDLAAGDPTGFVTTDNCSSGGPQGIDPKLLDTFPILVYSAVKNVEFGKAKAAAAALECAVCLSEFDQRDTLRLLPNCNHVFHPQCIDAWLACHVTCPVCRSRLRPAEDHRHGENKDVVIVIPNEVINARQVFGESSESRTELHSLGRCHSTGHSLGLGEVEGKDKEDLGKQITVNHGGMRRSASYNMFGGRRGEGSFIDSRVLDSLKVPFVSSGNVPSCSSSLHYPDV